MANKLLRSRETTDEHVSTWAGNVDFGPSFNHQCALDLRRSVRFFRRGILRLSSIMFNSPFEYDVIQLNVRSGPRWACIFYVHEHDRLGFWILSLETAVFNPGLYFIAFVDLVPIGTEKVSSRVVSGQILLVFDRILLTFSAVFGIS